jgi:hypothetical protein
MKWLNNIFSLIIALVLVSTSSFCQKVRYDIFLMGSKIGETTIERKDSGELKHYILKSLSDAKLFFVEKRSAMCTDVLYDKKGKMLASDFENQKNDDKLSTKAVWQNNKLLVDKDGAKTELPNEVTVSSLLLYFSEPKDHQKVFSERMGEFFEIVKQPDGTYLASLDGHTAVYTYLAGKLTELEMKSSVGSIVLKLAR